jgi:hypothetical protein
MTDVTMDQGQDGAGLSAADEQLLRELTERARVGGLKLIGEGRLQGSGSLEPGPRRSAPSSASVRRSIV